MEIKNKDDFQAFQKKWRGKRIFPAVFVHPDWLVEIDAIAAISE